MPKHEANLTASRALCLSRHVSNSLVAADWTSREEMWDGRQKGGGKVSSSKWHRAASVPVIGTWAGFQGLLLQEQVVVHLQTDPPTKKYGKQRKVKVLQWTLVKEKYGKV